MTTLSTEALTLLGTLAFVCLGIITGIRRTSRNGAFDPFHPLVFPLGYVAVATLLPALWLYTSSQPLGYISTNELSDRTYLLLCTATIGFMVGAGVPFAQRFRPPRDINYEALRDLGRVLIALPISFSAWGVLHGHVSTRGQGQDSFSAADTVTAAIQVVAPAAVLLILVGNSARNRVAYPTDWLLIGALVVTLGLNGRRSIALTTMLLLLMFLVRRGAGSVRLLAGLSLMAIFTNMVVDYRSSATGSVNSLGFVKTELRDLGSVAFTTGLTDHVGSHNMHGSTLVASAIRQLPSPIANSIIGPPTDTGSYLFRIYSNAPANNGYGFSIPAEGVLNFGIIGAFLIPFCAGLFLAWAYSTSNILGSRAIGWTYAIAVSSLPFAWRSDALGAVKGVLYPMIIAGLVASVARIRQHRFTSRPPHPPGPAAKLTLQPPQSRDRLAASREHHASITPFRHQDSAVLTISNRLRPPKARQKSMRTRSRVLLGATDQGLSSLSNIILVIVIARTVTIDHFGAFSFAWVIITTVLAVLRGYLGNSVSIASSTTKRQRETRYGLAIAGTVGLVTAISSAGAVWLLGGFGPGYVIGIFAPIVFMQDLLRFHTVAEGQPHLAVCSDAIWTAAMVTILGVIVVRPHAVGPGTAVVIWGLAGVASLFFLLLAARVVPTLRGISLWIRSDLTNRIHFGIVGALGAVGALVVISVATLIMGVHATAALRGASSVMGPLNVVMTAIPMVIVPEIRRSGATSEREIWRHIRRMGYVLAALALLAGIGASALPASIGRQLLGVSWPSIQPLLPVTGSEYAGLVLMAVAGAALRASDDGKNLMLVRLVKTIVGIVLGTFAALLVGTPISVSIAISASAALGFAHLLLIINADKSSNGNMSGESHTSIDESKSEVQLESTHISDAL